MTNDTKAGAAAIRRILLEDWSPVGEVPEDEYDTWLWPLYRLLREGVNAEALSSYLDKAADEFMGSRGSGGGISEANAETVRKLLALNLARTK